MKTTMVGKGWVADKVHLKEGIPIFSFDQVFDQIPDDDIKEYIVYDAATSEFVQYIIQ